MGQAQRRPRLGSTPIFHSTPEGSQNALLIGRRRSHHERMAQTLTRLLVHAVFSAKDRRNLITASIEADLHAYLGGICRNRDSPALAIGGTENHVHLLISLSKSISLVELMMTLKRDSSKWIKTKGDLFRDFLWQDGYGAFTIGASQVEALTRYILGQKERHKTKSFEDELVALARRYGVSCDNRYLWS